MGNVGEEEEEEEKGKSGMEKVLGQGSAGALPAVLAKAVAGEGKEEEEEEVKETGGAGSILEALQEEGVL